MKRTFVAGDGRLELAKLPPGVEIRRAPTGEWLVEQDGVVRTVHVSQGGPTVWLSAPGAADASLTTRWTLEAARRGGQHDAGSEVRAPMTGRVVAVHVAADQPVDKGQPLVVVEAMKMEHVLKSPKAAVVAKLLCVVGQQVEVGAELVQLREPAGEAAP
jgi:3-methylcrotonyl-CoA carboxylase alpha subunit